MTRFTLLSSLLAPAALTTFATALPSSSEVTYMGLEKAYSSPAPALRAGKDARVSLEVFRQDIELGELEFDYDGPPASKADVKDIDRVRTGFRAAFGAPAARGYVQFFGEEFYDSPGDFDHWGLGGGVAGFPSAHDFNDDIRLIIPYRAGFNVAWGEEDNGSIETTQAYVEFEGEVGVGGYFWGAMPSVGVYLTSLAGAGTIDNGVADSDYDFNGTNAGAYIQIAYKHDEFPMFASFRAMGGDVEGIVLSIGAAF
jgi:hypothetical protein